MKTYFLHYITLLSVFSLNCFSQKPKTNSADKEYYSYAYTVAVGTYEKLAEKGYKSEDMFQKLGNSYYFNGELDKATKWYDELFLMNPNQEPEYLYRYAHSLKASGQTSKASQMLEKFQQKAGSDIRGELLIKNKNYLDQIKANSGRYKIEDSGVNSKFSDYGSAFYGKKLVFSSVRDTGGSNQRTHTWTNQHFTNLFVSELDEEQNPSKVINKFSNKINSKFNESTPIFTKDGKTMYFTRNNYLEGKKGKDKNKVTLLKVYKASFENNKWDKITELPFNNDQYSVAHPTLSPDEKTLYFASDMPGTLGQSDLFKVKINEDGSYGTPQNLGKQINTEGRETFPLVTDENELFFASDGHPGLGGLDVFVTKLGADSVLGKIQNLGDGINSPKDDFAYLIDTQSRRGFVTSNRDGGHGYDDIYKFYETKRLICLQEISGFVTDGNNKTTLPDTKMSLLDSDLKLISSTVSDKTGNYKFEVECGKTYSVRAQNLGYTVKEQTITIADENGKLPLDFALEKEAMKLAIGDDLGKFFNIKMIYFDLDKYNIRTEAAADLEKILAVLNQNPNMKLDIRSHTDCRQTVKYNQFLSDQRAKATLAWLVNKGVDSNRLSGKGYGEMQLTNDCECEPTNKSNCTEEQHQMNRRSEFIITAL